MFVRGQWLFLRPGSITPHAKFKAEGLYPQLKKKVDVTLHFTTSTDHNSISRTLDVTGTIMLESGREMVMPGDNVTIEVNLITRLQSKRITDLQFVKVVELLVLVK